LNKLFFFGFEIERHNHMEKERVPIHSICIEQNPVLPTLRIPSIRGIRRCAQRHRTTQVKGKIHVSCETIGSNAELITLLLYDDNDYDENI
jgi:hypothetical protein